MLDIVNLFARIIDKFKLSVYKMKNHKRGCREYVKNTSNRQVTDVFFIIYLLNIITIIIKAITIIVSTTNANESKYIISNKTASIIAPPSFSQHKGCGLKVATTSAIFIFYANYYTIFFIQKQANKIKF